MDFQTHIKKVLTFKERPAYSAWYKIGNYDVVYLSASSSSTKQNTGIEVYTVA